MWAVLTDDFSAIAHTSGQQIAKFKTVKAQNRLADKYLSYLIDHQCPATCAVRIVTTWLKLYNFQAMPRFMLCFDKFHALCGEMILNSNPQLTPYGQSN
jgi:hypothetical protein